MEALRRDLEEAGRSSSVMISPLTEIFYLRLERELGLKASLVEALRRDLEEAGAELRAEQARSRQLAEDNRRLRLTAGQSARPGSTTDGESCSSLFIFTFNLRGSGSIHFLIWIRNQTVLHKKICKDLRYPYFFRSSFVHIAAVHHGEISSPQ